ncbi:MAG: hypothetical protein QNJ46_10525 [Leptolyngbyaceae cyanobacterium MO_188.B28]|nr:hypothetical protein [Leptolyngbyaceae cyanobacterium MO_188.B28]
MPVALKSDIGHYPDSDQTYKARVTSLRVITGQQAPDESDPSESPPVLRVVPQSPDREQAVFQLPDKSAAPLWLKILLSVYQGSTFVTGGLVASAMLIYGLTVGVNQLMVQGVHRLEGLQRSKQQLLAANEALKAHMAQQAENSGADSYIPHPAAAIFVQPASERLEPEAQPFKESGLISPQEVSKLLLPLGY